MRAKLNKIQEATTIDDVGKNVSRIYASLDNQQAEHQSSMIEIEGMIVGMPITILVDSRASFSYVNANLVMKCHLESSRLP